jgi:hypothetical protein
MDISSYAIHEPLWIEFINDLYHVQSDYKLFPKKGNVFTDVSKLFPKYFKHKKINKNKICSKKSINNKK